MKLKTAEALGLCLYFTSSKRADEVAEDNGAKTLIRPKIST
jgi:hypothetical protein